VAHFQVPEGRTLEDGMSDLGRWPAVPEGYRLFVSGNSGTERIGIQAGSRIELQLTGGMGLTVDTSQGLQARTLAAASGMSLADAQKAAPSPAAVQPATAAPHMATSNKHVFTLAGLKAGLTTLIASDSSGATRASLDIAVGDFANHPGMIVDLIADVCRGGDSLKIHALQRMLNYNDRNPNKDNVFEQNSASNRHPTLGNMTCGLVAKYRGEQVFENMAQVAHDWYKRPYHEPLSRKVTRRSDLKYRHRTIRSLQTALVAALTDDVPKAVRIGVVDRPDVMTPQAGKLVAYDRGGHTALVVGCNRTGTEFLYIDPWGGGSTLEYGGGIPGNAFPGRCWQLGIMVMKNDADRRPRGDDDGVNIMRQSDKTEGSFKYATGNFLEVVSAPLW
jgi:hypothetical protein